MPVPTVGKNEFSNEVVYVWSDKVNKFIPLSLDENGALNVSSFQEFTINNFNTELSTPSEALDIKSIKDFTIQVIQETGGVGIGIIKIQHSTDGSNWLDTGQSITGIAALLNIRIPTRYIRFVMSTLSLTTSTVNIIVQGK